MGGCCLARDGNMDGPRYTHVDCRHGQLLLQYVAYLAAQGVDREWLGQQLDIGVEQAMMDDGITGIAGRVEDFESWRTGARLLGKPVAVHSRQADISQEHGNFR